MAFIGDDKGDTYGRTHNYSNKPVYSTPAAPAQQSQQQQGQSQQQQQRYEYQDYLDQMAEAQRQQQEAYAKAMQERAAALVKWQQEQAALREAQQKSAYNPQKPWYEGRSLGEGIGGAQNTIAGKGSFGDWFTQGMGVDYLPQIFQQEAPYGSPEWIAQQGWERPAAGSLGKKPGYEGITQPSGNFPEAAYGLYPYSGGSYGYPTTPSKPDEELGYGGGGGNQQMPNYYGGWGGGGWGGYNYPSYDYTPAEEKPYYKNQVGGINWRI